MVGSGQNWDNSDRTPFENVCRVEGVKFHPHTFLIQLHVQEVDDIVRCANKSNISIVIP